MALWGPILRVARVAIPLARPSHVDHGAVTAPSEMIEVPESQPDHDPLTRRNRRYLGAHGTDVESIVSSEVPPDPSDVGSHDDTLDLSGRGSLTLGSTLSTSDPHSGSADSRPNHPPDEGDGEGDGPTTRKPRRHDTLDDLMDGKHDDTTRKESLVEQITHSQSQVEETTRTQPHMQDHDRTEQRVGGASDSQQHGADDNIIQESGLADEFLVYGEGDAQSLTTRTEGRGDDDDKDGRPLCFGNLTTATGSVSHVDGAVVTADACDWGIRDSLVE